MGFSLSREEYLKERATGKSKNKIAQSQGISGPALFHWLDKWGLKDADAEQRELTLLTGKSASVPTFASTPTPVLAPTPLHAEPTHAVLESNEQAATLAPGFPRTKLQVVSAETSHGVATIAVICPERTPDLRPHAMVDPLHVQFTMPLRSVEMRETINVSKLTRDELMQTAFGLMQEAVGQAHSDLAALLGESVAAQQIQGYVEHQLQKFLSNSVSETSP